MNDHALRLRPGLPLLFLFCTLTFCANSAEPARSANTRVLSIFGFLGAPANAPELEPVETSPALPETVDGQTRQNGSTAAEDEATPANRPGPGEHGFSNGCAPASWERVRVPKTKEALEIQLGKDFHVVRRGSFLIASDLDQQRFDYLINGVFACCREILEREFFTAKKPSRIVTVYIFRDRESYVRGLRDHFGMEPISPYGHYGHTKRYIVVNYATGPGTLVHELTHALMASDFPRAPIWVSEGLASLYEQCRVEGDSLRGEPNWRLPELQKAVTRGTLTPLAKLIETDTKDFRMLQESLNYAQSRYFCKFMEEKGVLRAVYARFRDNFRGDPDGSQAIQAVFGKPLAHVQQEWLQWIAAQKWEGGQPPTLSPADAANAAERSAAK